MLRLWIHQLTIHKCSTFISSGCKLLPRLSSRLSPLPWLEVSSSDWTRQWSYMNKCCENAQKTLMAPFVAVPEGQTHILQSTGQIKKRPFIWLPSDSWCTEWTLTAPPSLWKTSECLISILEIHDQARPIGFTGIFCRELYYNIRKKSTDAGKTYANCIKLLAVLHSSGQATNSTIHHNCPLQKHSLEWNWRPNRWKQSADS